MTKRKRRKRGGRKEEEDERGGKERVNTRERNERLKEVNGMKVERKKNGIDSLTGKIRKTTTK